MLELWGMQSTPSLPLLLGPFSPGFVAYHNDNSNISITTVIHANTKHNWQTQIHRRFRNSDTNVLLISDFDSSTRGERKFLKVFRIILC